MLGTSICAVVVISPATDADAGGDQHFAGHAPCGVLRQNGVENGVGNVIRHFVGMTLSD